MNASHLSTVAAKATTYGSLGQDGQKISSLASGTCESSNDAKDVKKTTSTVQDYDSDLLCVGTWATKKQHPETIISPGEARKVVLQHPCTHHQAIHEACLGSINDHRAIISLLRDPYPEKSTARADRLCAGSSSALACTCVTEIGADIDGAQVAAVTTNGDKVHGRQNNGIN